MTATRSIAARVKIVAAVTTLLILIGAGGAAAYWTASAQLDGSAKAAEVGITQTDPLKLETVYTSGTLKAADTVTVHNTGTAPAELSVVLDAQGGSALPSSLRFVIVTASESAACDTSTTHLQPLADGHLPLDLGTVEAGKSIDLCVRTSLPARGVFVNAGQTTKITLTSTLKYADGQDWTRSTGSSVPQSVHQDPAAGAETAVCDDHILDGSFGKSSQRFTVPTTSGGASVEYRAFVARDQQTAPLSSAQLSIEERRSDVRAHVSEDDLWAVATAHGWGTGTQWFVLEKRAVGAGDDEWTVAGVGTFRLTRILGIKDAFC